MFLLISPGSITRLILNEAITNFIKYAFYHHGREMTMILKLVGFLQIANNRKGISTDVNLTQSISFDFEMMKGLSQ